MDKRSIHQINVSNIVDNLHLHRNIIVGAVMMRDFVRFAGAPSNCCTNVGQIFVQGAANYSLSTVYIYLQYLDEEF